MTRKPQFPTPTTPEQVEADLAAQEAARKEHEALDQLNALVRQHGLSFRAYQGGGGAFQHPRYGLLTIPYATRVQDLALLKLWLQESAAQASKRRLQWRRKEHLPWAIALMLALLATVLLQRPMHNLTYRLFYAEQVERTVEQALKNR